jgi:hypothetical protein
LRPSEIELLVLLTDVLAALNQPDYRGRQVIPIMKSKVSWKENEVSGVYLITS